MTDEHQTADNSGEQSSSLGADGLESAVSPESSFSSPVIKATDVELKSNFCFNDFWMHLPAVLHYLEDSVGATTGHTHGGHFGN